LTGKAGTQETNEVNFIYTLEIKGKLWLETKRYAFLKKPRLLKKSFKKLYWVF